ncbi:MAG TPA: UdgX family uracil-DNA binding protein [Candidatus Limnocylindrales bacterium]|nr:UdgX family uracil-DNA binding protein [Candidatus Limnocylindrales bacterium]
MPPGADLETVRRAAAGCTACDLYRRATQTVFGEGPVGAPLMLIGEQPGDREDLAGHPFVGPAGRVLDEALEAAGIDRERVFVTNVVKHFKWRPSGKRRLHERPNAAEIRACRPWLEAELALVRPAVLVLLGATAAQAVMGPSFRVSRQRGVVVRSPFGTAAVATVHPSAILRAETPEDREAGFAALVADLSVAVGAVAGGRREPAPD